MFMFAINADTRKQKNNGLVNKVSFEFDDHLILDLYILILSFWVR